MCQLSRHLNEEFMNRRRFVHWLSTLPLWNLVGRRAVAQSAALSTAELATLRDVAGVVLPSVLGKSRINAVTAGFLRGLGGPLPAAQRCLCSPFPLPPHFPHHTLCRPRR